jgi:hypothetical protein
MKHAQVFFVFACFILALSPFAARGTTFTLSDSALMSLDYYYTSGYPQGATITKITDISGVGVQYDILYSDPLNSQNKMPTLCLLSTTWGGSGALTKCDISTFDTFALEFTLVSESGVSSPDAVGPLIVGAYINNVFQPRVIASNNPHTPASATSVSPTYNNSQIVTIGFTCEIPYWWYTPSTSPWDPSGARISLLVESAPGAVVITPEPATLLLLGLGAAIVRRKRS